MERVPTPVAGVVMATGVAREPGLGLAVAVGIGLMALATVGGAVLRWRLPRASPVPLAVAAACLLGVVGADLAPDIWRGMAAVGLPWWSAPLAAMAGVAGAGALLRPGCPCRPGLARGGGTGVALAAHRVLEGAAVAVTGSVAVVAALVLHAASEGFALTSLLGGERRRTIASWLTLACVAPAVGAVVLSVVPLPDQADPLLTAVVAGVLVRMALAAWQLAVAGRGADRPRGSLLRRSGWWPARPAVRSDRTVGPARG
ncbi:MAG TPA: hypothetical protein VE152_08835 [Acidimicrobiales bacterium]|nr:hypothetical protein [Acidimicrobiales bacterium]